MWSSSSSRNAAARCAGDSGAGITPRLRETRGVERGILVAVWVTLPLTAGSAAADALDGWSTAPQIVASHHAGGLGDIERVFVQSRRGHDDLFDGGFLGVGSGNGKHRDYGDAQGVTGTHVNRFLKQMTRRDAQASQDSCR